jgi:hypothetical protein
MQGAEERRLRRMGNTPQGGAIEGNAADDVLLVIRDNCFVLTSPIKSFKNKGPIIKKILWRTSRLGESQISP